jgi:NADH-quinone oxidoreductase subunit E
MANRRLAPVEAQPQSFAFTAENENWADGQIAKYPEGRQASAVIPLLWKAQEQAGGWLPQKAIEAVADKLGMPYIRVLEVATFYTMFALEPVGRYWIQVCGTVPCDSCGARELKDMLHARLGAPGHVDATGTFSWLEVECLGACCNAPMVQINHDYYEDLTPESLGQVLDDLAAGRPTKPGSQTGRVSSEPAGAVNTLQDPTLFDGSRVGAWRKRFEQTAVQGADPAKGGGKGAEAQARTEAATTEQRAASEPRIAKPDAGRASERPVTDAPAQRAANGETPVDPKDRVGHAEPSRSTAAAPKSGPEEQAPKSGASYVASPGKEGEAVTKAGEGDAPRGVEPAREPKIPVGGRADGIPPGPTGSSKDEA